MNVLWQLAVLWATINLVVWSTRFTFFVSGVIFSKITSIYNSLINTLAKRSIAPLRNKRAGLDYPMI